MSEIVKIYTMMLQPLLSLGLKAAFGEYQQFEYAGSFDDVSDLRSAMDQCKDDVMILVIDYQPEYDMYQKFFAFIRQHYPNLKILIFLPMAPDDGIVIRALRIGADGYLLQSATQEVLIQAMEAMASGRSYLQSQVTPVALSELRKPIYTMQEYNDKIQLSERERMLMQLAADGLNNGQIAEVLGLAEKTIRNLWSTLFEKLGMTDRTQAVLWAIRTGHAELR
jgi:DNA-binding NarL/FixJ family response regulator